MAGLKYIRQGWFLRCLNGVFVFCFTILFVFFVASLPLVVRQIEGDLTFRPAFFLLIVDYVKGIFNGHSFVFFMGDLQWNLLDKIPGFFLNSLFYLSVSSLTGIVIGVPLGILSYKKRVTLSQKVLLFINAIPDFFLIVMLQVGVILLNKATGFRLAKIAMTTTPPILLPLIAMSIYPTIYLIRQMSAATYTITCQDYILFARSRGLSKSQIFFRHVIPALLPLLSADVTKITLMILSNMFIAEQLFRISGVTQALFKYGLNGGYRFTLVVNCLLCILLLYLIVSQGLKFIIWLVRKQAGIS